MAYPLSPNDPKCFKHQKKVMCKLRKRIVLLTAGALPGLEEGQDTAVSWAACAKAKTRV